MRDVRELTTSFRQLGLLSKFMLAAIFVAALIITLISYVFVMNTDRLAITNAKMSLSDSVLLMAPVIDGAMASGDIVTARQILLNFSEQDGVACVDYFYAGAAMQTITAIKLPGDGCADIALTARDYIDVEMAASSQGAYHFLIDGDVFNTARNQQLAMTIMMAAGSIFLSLMIMVIFFRLQFIAPIKDLQHAMRHSRPDAPRLTHVARDDELGKLGQSYNKMAIDLKNYYARVKTYQAELSQSEAKFKAMAEISGDWFFETDENLNFTYLSNRFFEITDIDPATLIGASHLPQDEAKMQTAHWQAHIKTIEAREDFRNFEYQFETETKRFILRISGKPRWSDTGAFEGYYGTGTDVTDIANDRQLLEEANRNFGDSITYASSIQRGLLTRPQELRSHLGQVASLWQPKDLVGGDFYWVGRIGSSRYFVFFDCTGHGVPGALMTLITVSVLDTIISASPMALPAAQMLERIHRGVNAKLGITAEKEGKDGLDCAVVKFNASEGGLEFAGASIDLFHVTSKMDVTRIRGDKHVLGYRAYDAPRDFTSHQLAIDGSTFVLITDGMATQIGAETKRVLGTRRIMEALQQADNHSPVKLVRALGRCLKNWQGSEERRDDVSFVAFNLLD